MKLGAVFPTTQIGTDPGAAREYAQAAEELGYDYLVIFDHVLGVDARHYPGWQGFYDMGDQFHEPFVLMGYLAGVTRRIGFSTAIIILPQPQTALVAKQAAEADVLSGGRLRMGIGVGWNAVEYEALGENFRDRGRRYEEQIALLRELWTKESVDFEGTWHRGAARGHQPVAGAAAHTAVAGHAASIAGAGASAHRYDGGRLGAHYPRGQSGRYVSPDVGADTGYAREAGRDPMEIGVECFVVAYERPPEEWAALARGWEAAGATHVSFYTLRSGYTSREQHIDAIRRFKEDLS